MCGAGPTVSEQVLAVLFLFGIGAAELAQCVINPFACFNEYDPAPASAFSVSRLASSV